MSKKIGAPTKLDNEKLRTRLLRLIRKDGMLKHSVRSVGISYQTFCLYRSNHPEFAQQVDDAEEAWLDELELASNRLAKADGAHMRFVLACKRPEKYSQKHQVAHSGGVTIQVVEDDGWYGNRAHDLATQSVAPSNGHSLEPSTVQGGGLRTAMGKNGHGANGSG